MATKRTRIEQCLAISGTVWPMLGVLPPCIVDQMRANVRRLPSQLAYNDRQGPRHA